jgi:hypothetical protein
MRFVSQYKKFGIQIRPIREMVLAGGERQTLVEPLYIRFWQGDISDHEIRVAEKFWGAFAGRTVERDRMTLTPLLNRLSVFDTEQGQRELNWDDETREAVEQALLSRQGQSLVHVPAEKLQPPWPTYDSFSGSLGDLLEKIRQDGHDLGSVLAYEATDGQRRAPVISFLTEEIDRAEREEAAGEFVRA